MKIDLTEADVVLLMQALTRLQPEHNGESIQRWALIEKLAKLLPPGAARRGEPRTTETNRRRYRSVPDPRWKRPAPRSR